MTHQQRTPLLIGEVFVDVAITPADIENKLRLGGVTHAARSFWALGQRFHAAVVTPAYLVRLVQTYFQRLGCANLTVLGEVKGAPNVTLIFDPTEVADQEYETLLRDEKTVELRRLETEFRDVEDALIFPGTFPLQHVCAMLPSHCRLHLDVAYDIENPDLLTYLEQPLQTIFLSTSSPLFLSLDAANIKDVCAVFSNSMPTYFLLKENRGGSRLFETATSNIEEIPAQLGTTNNSVGVGDVFAAAFLTHLRRTGPVEAAWRATYASSAYSQTTDLDIFKKYVERDARLSLEEMRSLSGTSLPWDARPTFPIYLAAPDFAAADRTNLERVLRMLAYHNFQVRRPIVENGELPAGADEATLRATYQKDYDLLKVCALVFAVPTTRDPGTLVEIGLAIEAQIPVVVYDPAHECANTMVIAGSALYSGDLDACLNAVFDLLSRRRASR